MRYYLLVTLAFFSAAELGARAWTHFRGNPVDRALSVLRPDAKLGWKARPNLRTVFFGAALNTDAAGNRAGPAVPGATSSLVTYGPSSAFGWGVEAEDTYTALAGGLLRASGRNLSQIGFSSRQGALLLEESPPPPGSVILFAYGINDLDRFRFFFPTAATDAEFFAAPIPAAALRIAALGAHWHSFRYLARFAAWIRGRIDCRLPRRLPRRVPDAEFFANLEKFTDAAGKSQGRLIVIDTPYWPVPEAEPTPDADQLYSDAQAAAEAGACRKSRELFGGFLAAETDRIIRDQRRLNTALAKWAAERGVALVRASQILGAREDFADPIHPSRRGHEKIARAVAELMVRKFPK